LSVSNGASAYIKVIAIVQALVLCLTLYWLYVCEAINRKGIEQALLPPTFSAGIAWILTYGLGLLPESTGKGEVVRAVFQSLAWGSLFALAYLGCLRLLFAGLLSELISYCPAQVKLKRLLLIS